jgi:hypothetical protein
MYHNIDKIRYDGYGRSHVGRTPARADFKVPPPPPGPPLGPYGYALATIATINFTQVNSRRSQEWLSHSRPPKDDLRECQRSEPICRRNAFTRGY